MQKCEIMDGWIYWYVNEKKNVKKIFDVDHNCQASSWTNAGNEWINEWMDGLPEAYDAT